jgi:hypothetical protein
MSGKKIPPQLFCKKLLTYEWFAKSFNSVFELPLLRNAQKRHKTVNIKSPTYLL